MSSLYHAYGLCVFDGCVFIAIAGMFFLLSHKFGIERCAFLRQYGVRDLRVSGKHQHQTFRDRRCIEPSQWDGKQVP